MPSDMAFRHMVLGTICNGDKMMLRVWIMQINLLLNGYLLFAYLTSTRNLDLDGSSKSLISVQMLITIILKIEKQIIIVKKMRLKTLFEKSITLMAEWMDTEPYMRILFVKEHTNGY